MLLANTNLIIINKGNRVEQDIKGDRTKGADHTEIKEEHPHTETLIIGIVSTHIHRENHKDTTVLMSIATYAKKNQKLFDN